MVQTDELLLKSTNAQPNATGSETVAMSSWEKRKRTLIVYLIGFMVSLFSDINLLLKVYQQ